MWTWADMNWEFGTDVCALSDIKQIVSGNYCLAQGPSLVLCGDLEGWDGGRWEGGDT